MPCDLESEYGGRECTPKSRGSGGQRAYVRVKGTISPGCEWVARGVSGWGRGVRAVEDSAYERSKGERALGVCILPLCAGGGRSCARSTVSCVHRLEVVTHTGE